MSSDSWDQMKKAKEDAYFEEQNRAALARLKQQRGDKKRASPITGEPMEQITIKGVVVDRCTTSGGIWLDAGELEEIIKHSKADESGDNWLSGFLSAITGKKY